MTKAPASYDSLRHEIQAAYDGLTPHLQRLARFALESPNNVALETVASIAASTGVQPSTLIRFAKEFGYTGFSEMQKVFRLRLIEGAPAFRDQIYQHNARLEQIAGDDPAAILNEFCEASVLCLQRLQQTTPVGKLHAALNLLNEAHHIYVIAQRRAFPIAAYLAYGLTRLEIRCQLLDNVGGMVPQQIVTLRPDDLLVAIAFAEYAELTVEAVRDAHIRGVPTLTITDAAHSPLAKHGTVFFTVDDADIHRFRPIAGSISLVQSLIIALSYRRDAGKAPDKLELADRKRKRP